MNQTENLSLPQWEKTDRIMMDDFNDAFDKIDAGVKAANDAAAAAPRIAFGSYVGDGTYGEGHSTALHLGFMPRALVVLGEATNDGDHMVLIYPYGYARSSDGNNTECRVTWLSNGVQWINFAGQQQQFNRNGNTYYYMAIQ